MTEKTREQLVKDALKWADNAKPLEGDGADTLANKWTEENEDLAASIARDGTIKKS